MPNDATVQADVLPAIPGYELLDLIGRGGMGVVYRARDQRLERDVAIKLLSEKAEANSSAAARFNVEAKITGQLQHPGIPAVHELGRLPDGRPFLAMKLVKGRTLQQLLDETVPASHIEREGPGAKASTDLRERGRSLAIFEQVCHAVGYAHAHRVIHRDLKPSNIMVGAFSEVQVMDWGLAKVLEASSPTHQRDESAEDPFATRPEPSVIDTPKAAGSATRTGSVLGTPPYMPPEQAGGEIRKLNPQSDVFGLGAILCQILIGRPPYQGRDAHEVRLLAVRGELQEVIACLDQCGAEPDVVALCKKCLAFNQDDRPADGRAVAEEVGRIRNQAEARARQAELAQARAEVQVADQARRRRMLLGAATALALVLLVGLGVSLWQMSIARQERDAKDVALTAEKKARDQAFAALRSMTDEVVQRKLAAGQGYTLTDDDRAFLRGVIAQYDAFAAIKGDDADSQATRAEGRARVGLMRHRLGELKEAEADFGTAVGIQTRLAAEFPTSPEFRRELAASLNNRGHLLNDTGRLKDAEADFDISLSIRNQLTAEFPSSPEFRQDLATSHNNRGVLLSNTGRLKEAEADYDAAVSIRKQLADEFPGRPEFRRELATTHNNRATLLENKSRLKEAGADYKAALGIQKQLVADFPARPEFRRDLARSHNNRGLMLRDMGQAQDAEADVDTAVAIYKQLAAEFPTRPEFRRELAVGHNSRGLLREDTGRPNEAKADYDAALDIYKPLATDFPTWPEFRRELARSYSNRGNLLSGMARQKEAEVDHDAAVGIRRQLAADFPTRPEFRRELAVSHNNRGALLRAVGRLKDAEADYNAALGIYKQLTADFPTQIRFRQELARSHNNQGLLLRDTGRLKESEAGYYAALGIYEQLAADFPARPDFRNELAGALGNLAQLQQQQKNWAEAKRLLLEGRPHHLAALKISPRNPTYQQFYRNHLMILTSVHAALLEKDDAIRTAETVRDLGWNASADAYDAACFLSRCHPIIEKHDKLDDKQREEAARFFGDEAMKLLREAVSKGWKDAAHMKKDADLDPLRQREDFQKLLADLEGATPDPALGTKQTMLARGRTGGGK